MNNPLLKNNKTEMFDDIQHRTSHYNRILAARSLYTKNPKVRESLLDHIHCKERYNSESRRKSDNKKLVESLLKIQNNQSRYSISSVEFKSPKSLKNEYLQKGHRNKIIGGNMELYRKIVQVIPEVGSRKQWKIRFKKQKKYQKLLTNRRESFMKLDQQFYDTFSKMKKVKTESSQLKVETHKKQSFRDKLSQRFCTEGNNKY